MDMGQAAPHRYRFAQFELDPRSGELQRNGVTQQLQGQLLQALLLLVERSGDVVTREELQRHLWRDETFVDFEHGLNSIIKRLREALGDSADSPMFIQTLPRRGYRFLIQPETLPAGASINPDVATLSVVRPSSVPPVGILITSIVALVAVAFAAFWFMERRAVPPSRPLRLAVLPFENLTGNHEQQFFADGLHEEMILRLGRIRPSALTVIARTSVIRYQDAPKAIAAIGRELGVDFVLEGSVRRAGDRVRVTTKLIRPADQSQLWTESYDRSWSDIFAIQSDVSARVADSLAVELLPSSQAIASESHISPKAYEHFLRGRFYWNQRTSDPSGQLARAIDEFRLAISEQPDYALAYAGLADSYNSIFFANPAVGETPFTNARSALQQALELDSRLASAYSTLAWMTLHVDRNLPEAERVFDRALALDPTDPLTRFRHAHLLAIRGRVREAEEEAEAARRADPLSATIADILGWFAYYRGDNGAAMQRFTEASQLEGNPTKLHVFSAYLHATANDCAGANEELRPWARDVQTLRMAEGVFARARCDDPAAIADLEQALLTRRLTYSIAMFHFARHDMDAFYDWLNRAIDERYPEPLYLAVDPVFNSERQDPRFQQALHRAGL